MLIELRIRNYAVIEDLAVTLEPGLNVLTGETGAGKSIIVGALSLLLGERASSDVVRPGAERATIEGVFDVSAEPRIAALLEEHGIESEEGLLILRREIAAEGRNRAWVNGAAATAALVGELGGRLVDLHGQHEHQTLLRPDEQRAILDAFTGATDVAAALRDAHATLSGIDRELGDFDRRRREIEQRADFLRFQTGEIEAAEPRIGEEEALAAEVLRLEHSEELIRDSGSLHEALYAAEESVTARLGGLRRTLRRLLEIDASQGDAQELLDTALYSLEELGRRMGEYAATVEHDPGRLDAIRRRQDTLFRLKSKYGGSIEEVIATAESARDELDRLERAELDRRSLERARADAATALDSLAASLSASRAAGAGDLARRVGDMLPDLGLAAARFVVELRPRDAIAAHGAEDVEFLVSLNPGFEPRPLRRVASGGELSRVMLALKTVLADVDAIPSLVFDEVDAGVGGAVGHRLGALLKTVALRHQVFAITHLPQIASRADHHLRVEKEERKGIALTRVTPLRDDERVRELVRMLGGDPADSDSFDHARKLLATAS
ncbi:MAG TPA: DNA repair protein RecN [Longimicrobiales bacterium]|nr:DNA repair protein RecN [Longimicrobiales bacterium]